jgi:hypothetical protein
LLFIKLKCLNVLYLDFLKEVDPAIIKDLYLAPLVLKHNITMAKQVISNNLGFCVINFTSAIFKYSIGKSSAYWMYTPKKKEC